MSLKTVELGDICDITNGSTPSRTNNEYWDFGNISWFTIEDIRKFGRVITKTNQHITEKALQETSLRILPVNTVLLCCTASVGEYAITKIPLCTNQQFNGLTLKTKEVLPEFLYYFVSTLKDELLRVSGSATINFVAVSKLKKIKFSYPPLSTQQKIVEKLDAIFAEIDKATAAAEANIKNAEALFQSYLTDIFEREGNGWVAKTVGELAIEKVILKPFDGNHGEIHPVAADYTSAGVPFLMASDLKNGVVDLVNSKFISKALAETLRVGFAINNDVLLTHKGTIGRVAKLTTDMEYVMLTPQITGYRVLNEQILSRDYLLFFFQSDFFQKQLYEMAKGGSTRAYAGITKQSSLVIKIPPLSTQLDLIQRFKEIEKITKRLIYSYANKVNLCSIFRQAILKQAFNGELIKE